MGLKLKGVLRTCKCTGARTYEHSHMLHPLLQADGQFQQTCWRSAAQCQQKTMSQVTYGQLIGEQQATLQQIHTLGVCDALGYVMLPFCLNMQFKTP